MYVLEGLHCMELSVGNNTKSLWVGIKGHTNKADVVGDFYRPPCQDNDTNGLFYKELRISLSTVLSLWVTRASRC